MDAIDTWFQQRGWRPFDFQRQAWQAYRAGHSGLIHAPTGMGKTLAVWFGPVAEFLDERQGKKPLKQPPPIQVLWLTPLRALANDTAANLRETVDELGLNWTVELRTGDVSSSVRARQRKRLPSALITTPESLSLLLSYPEARDRFASLRCVVVDEWHELLGTKRGIQTELSLARLRRWLPTLRTWGLSATLGNLDQALHALLGAQADTEQACMIQGHVPKDIVIDTLVPRDMERFPWAGHLGTRLLDQVIEVIEQANTTLVFTNTRSQAELWFHHILKKRTDLIGRVALHHGSLDHKLRVQVEEKIRQGELLAVVCTSSMDLGVDFAPVDQVIQLGSPKGIARLMQRAGRSGHQPGRVSRIVCVPTHAFELVEFSAARMAVQQRRIESREPLSRPFDVLAQHLVTMSMAEGFVEEELREEVRTTYAYRDMGEQEWQWAMDFVQRGGPALKAYPEYARIAAKGMRYWVSTPQIARRHRMSMGTITSDSVMQVRLGGRSLGTVEESFISRLRPGDCFVFSGRILELVRVRQMVAHAKIARRKSGSVPRWGGGRFPLSTQLADAVLERFEQASGPGFPACQGMADKDVCPTGIDPEMQAVLPLLALQAQWSRLPGRGELLIETTPTEAGHHHFLYPFQGRLVHEGIAALLAHRLSQIEPRSVAINFNDYGLELLTPDPLDLNEAGWRDLLHTDRLVDELLACLNATEMARRQFRDIARVAGLVFTGYPGEARSTRHLQASSDLFFDVFGEFDPDNLLLDQARREVLEQQLEVRRLRAALERMAGMRLAIVPTPRLTPLAFPLWADRLRESLVSTQSWEQQVQQMIVQLEEEIAAGEA